MIPLWGRGGSIEGEAFTQVFTGKMFGKEHPKFGIGRSMAPPPLVAANGNVAWMQVRAGFLT